MAKLVFGTGCGKFKIKYDIDKSSSDYVPLPENPDVPVPVIPITGYGDMFKSVYDQNSNGKADWADNIPISGVVNLQDKLNELSNQGGSGVSKEIITVTNNGGNTFKPGSPVAQNSTTYISGSSLPPRQRIIGLAVNDSAPGDELKIQLSGYMILPTTAWDEVTGTDGGLVVGRSYFIDDSGNLSLDAPTEAPEYLIKIGYSSTPTTFLIDLDIAVKL